MSEQFLEEQLARIRRLAEQMTGLEDHSARIHEHAARDREVAKENPLHQARDLRLYVEDDPPRRRRRR